MITVLKSPAIPPFAIIEGDIHAVAGADVPHSVVKQTGQYIIDALAVWKERFPQIEVVESVIMPDHIHLCLNVRQYLPHGLSLAVSGLKGLCSRLRHSAISAKFGLVAMEPVFTEGFNDRIAYTPEQWKRQIGYVRDNPRRYLLKKLFPDFLLRKWRIKIGDEEFCAKGNIMLLKEPLLIFVKFSRRWSEEESELYQQDSRLKIDNGAVAVSPFIHPKERELRDYAIGEGGAYVRICENGFSDRESAGGFEFSLMSAGRLLLVAPIEHDTLKRNMSYSYARKLNAIAAKLVEGSVSGVQWSIRPL